MHLVAAIGPAVKPLKHSSAVLFAGWNAVCWDWPRSCWQQQLRSAYESAVLL